MQPRPYQSTCLTSIHDGFREFRIQLAVLPTGSGKTCIFSWLAKDYEAQGKRTLILAHREELIDQAILKLHASTGLFAQKEKAEFRASRQAKVVVASIQSMIRRLGEWDFKHFDLVIADEAHHAISDSWQRVLGHFSGAKVLGVTATPDRGDKRNLGKYFENIPFEISLFDLINQGYLSRIAVKSVPLEIDLRKVRQTAGDYNESDLGDALAPYLRSIARSLKEDAAFRRTLVFLPLIATSKAFTAICQDEGINACHIDGTSPDRKEILAQFSHGEFDILCNAMLLTEGYDDPGIDCVVILRPTRSRALYCQMVGRGTRVADGKSNLLLLDFLWLHEKHNLIRPAHLVAPSDEVAAEITALAEAKPGGASQEELDLEGLASEAQVTREEKLRKELESKAKRKRREIDAMEFCLSLHATEIAEFEPACPWEFKPVTRNQESALRGFGFDVESLKNCGHASKILDLLITRSRMHLATPKQMRLMRQLGHPKPDTATFEQARAFLDARLKRQEAA